MRGTERPVVAIDAVSSTAFVRHVLATCAAGKVVLIAHTQASRPEATGLRIESRLQPDVGTGWLDAEYRPLDDDAPAQVVFTSGTEGEPKAIVLSHRNLADTVRRLNEVMGVDASIREYVGVPVTHSFGLGRCRAVLAAGGKVYLPEMGFNPTEIVAMLRAGEINAISAVPTLWRVLLQNRAMFADCAERVRWIEIGSQYMSREEKLALASLFPKARIVQHYGLTEASRSTFLVVSGEEESRLESVGRPTGGVEVSISPGGRIRIRGPHVAMGRMVNGRLQPLADAQGWFETSDLGRLEDGFLYYEGRADDIINSGGLKVAPEPLEAAVKQALPHLQDVAVCGVPDALRGEGFLVAVQGAHPGDDEAIVEAVDDALSRRNISARTSIHVRHVESMPRTANGKLQRRKLANQFTSAEAPTPSSAETPRTVLALFQRRFGRDRLKPGMSFTDLGGDSLNYVQMAMDLERYLGRLPANWERLSIAELERLRANAALRKRKLLEPLDSGTALRAFAITTVVAIHAGFGFLYGATIMLMMLVGYNFARFQSASLQRGQVWSTLWDFSKKILLPFYVILVAYTLLYHDLEWESFLLFSNFVYRSSNNLVPVWFVLNLVQVLAIVGLLFSLAPVRAWFGRNVWRSSMTVLVMVTAFHALMYVFVHRFEYDLFLPHMYLPVFWLGWTAFHAEGWRQKLAVTALLFALVPLNVNVGIQHLWLLFAGLWIIWVPRVYFPPLVNRIAGAVAAATFFIFIFNQSLLLVVEDTLARFDIASRTMEFVVAMGVCLLIWRLYEAAVVARGGRR